MTDADCAFCSSEIDVSVFAETGEFRAIYNIAPIVPGHVLVVPRRHEPSMLALSDQEFADFWLFGRQVTKFILDTFNTRAFDWTIQEKPEAGQTVPHLHLHIIPRVPDDFPNPGDWYPRLREAKIVDHAKDVIDSNDRVRLDLNERRRIAKTLSEAWTKW